MRRLSLRASLILRAIQHLYLQSIERSYADFLLLLFCDSGILGQRGAGGLETWRARQELLLEIL